MILREKEVHRAIITKSKSPPSRESGQLDYSSISEYLAVFLLEFLHELNECFGAFDRHGVVNRGAHPADRAMSLEADQIVLLRFLGKGIFELLRGEAERNV